MTGAELQDMAQLRLEEAETLFDAGKFDGCVYLCGYVVELGLKAVICKTLNLSEYPEAKQAFKTHNMEDLFLFAGLKHARDALSASLRAKWDLVTKLGTDVRYKPRNTYNETEALECLDALRHSADGVLTWLKTKW